ncbi:unnamed protein product, partial [Ectocarpus fasciculatus]
RDEGGRERASTAAEWLLEEAARRLATHEFTETFKSDAPDHVLISLLHALTVAVAGSPRRKHLAETLFSRLSSSYSSSSSSSSSGSFSSSPAAGTAAAAAAVAHVPRPGLIRFLYERCLFPPTGGVERTAATAM